MANQLSQQLQQATLYDNDTPQTILKKMLSVRSVVSTTYSFAAKNQEVSGDESLQYFFQIGSGNCGFVFEQRGTVQVVKKARAHGPEEADLWNDYLMHKKVELGFLKASGFGIHTIHIPRAIMYIGGKDEDWWASNSHRFPKDFQAPANLLMSERILPLPKVIREALIQLYCPAHLQDASFADPGNNACLVRVYLGQNAHVRQPGARPQKFFTLRNFKLHLNQMVDLGLDVDMFATIMANALAIMHCEVRIDAHDVEFVLGSAPAEAHYRGPTYEQLKNLPPNSSTHTVGDGMTFHKRAVHLWCLDFNLCKEIELDDKGVKTAVEAFCVNDRYYPRPSVDPKLWQIFCNSYLSLSSKILGQTKYESFPRKFIEGVVEGMTQYAGRP